MKTVVAFPDQVRTETAAAHWIARLDRGALSDQENHALRVWLHEDPAHKAVLYRMADLWGEMDNLTLLAELFPPTAKPGRSFQQWLPRCSIVAICLLAIGLSMTMLPPSRQAPTPGGTVAESDANEWVYRTRQGERSVTTLQDGSLLTLNTQSEAAVHIDPQRRTVHLIRGEAHFQVAKDKGRPFVVHAGNGQIVALGTAFNVRFVDQQVEVLVDEGVVEVMTQPSINRPSKEAPPLTAPQTARLTLEQGGSARYAQAITQSGVLPLSTIERRLAWRRGKWMFEGETLAEVLNEVTRYSPHEIIIGSPDLAKLKVGGYFDIGDIDGFLGALQTGFDIKVVREGNHFHLYAGATMEEG